MIEIRLTKGVILVASEAIVSRVGYDKTARMSVQLEEKRYALSWLWEERTTSALSRLLWICQRIDSGGNIILTPSVDITGIAWSTYWHRPRITVLQVKPGGLERSAKNVMFCSLEKVEIYWATIKIQGKKFQCLFARVVHQV